jgi:hypothetical protein
MPVDGEPFAAKLVALDGAGRVVFQPVNEAGESTGSPRTFDLDAFVRWGNPATIAPQPIILLSDGSRLVAAADWSGSPAVRLEGDSLVVRTNEWGDVRLARQQLRGVVFAQRNSPADRRRLEDWVRAADSTQEQLLLTNKDRVTGPIKAFPGGSLTFATDAGDAKLPISRVEAFAFGRQTGDTGGAPSVESEPADAPLLLGMRSGSLLRAVHATANENVCELTLDGGTVLKGNAFEDLVYLQTVRSNRFVYLSDVEPADYRHVPYLDLPWPYKRDHNVLGGPLVAGGKCFTKGLGMHSAARLTYKLERAYKRFDALAAIDDSALKRGSVTFAVYVLRDGKWQLAYTSDVVRGGEAPRNISVDVSGADAMTLVVDFADRGDELDHADWLDARLIGN